MASAVKKTIHQHALEIQKPWLAYLATKPATTEGSIALEWTIAPDGKPTQVAVVHSDFDQVAFSEGVRDALAGIAFAPPPSGLPHHVTHKLVFKREPEGLATPTPPTPNVK
jgi:TonB family protein